MLSSLILQMALLGQVGADPATAPTAAPAPAATAGATTSGAPTAPKHEPGILTRLLKNATLVGAEWVLWILVLLSIISVAPIVERCLYFYNHRVDGEQLGQ